ncbi:A disintegrin and metalloproteinase with thrombospondin motifs adt-2-like isoform X2 [Ostrea edulis]|uniref:A disintegrin and metalloproteinase with thrombospondin motifs adt-2-like isoform X2 n=1 Tax=Ostrea edulis TaxID=37623 RepID=UPI002094AC99|nr:A disintegrin and metalloproteinase with thrombospondin motifs adt-2-like isoform X2 [Ostrea edulis]
MKNMSVIERELFASRNPVYIALYFILTIQFSGILICAGHLNEKEQTYTLNIPWHIGNHHPRHVQYTVHGIPEIQTLRLKRNDNINLNVPTCVIDQGFTICEYGNVQDIAFYHTTDKQGAFSIRLDPTTPNTKTQLEGVLVAGKDAFVLEPNGPLSHSITPAHNHRIVKRSSYVNNWHASTGRHEMSYMDRRMVQLTDRHTFQDFQENMLHDVNYSTKRPYVVEVLVLIDNSLYQKFYKRHRGDEQETMTKLKYYFAHIVNGMDLRYSSINNTGFTISIRLAGFFIAKNTSDLPFVMTYRQGGDRRSKVDGSSTLLGLTNFLKSKKDLPHHDHAMLFTEYDATNGRGYILGTSYLSGICTAMSTSVIVDHGSYNSAGIAAHELGHNLGVIYHDGDDNTVSRHCPRELNYIMAPSSAIINSKTKEYSFKFSDCSIAQMEDHVNLLTQRARIFRRKGNCLADDAGPSYATMVVKPYLSIPPGQLEDVHTQCRQLYGNASFMCPPATTDEMCYKMYCFDPGRKMCITGSEQRAAMGTSCGDKKWCKLGKCVRDEKAPTVPDNCPFPDVPPPRASCKEDASPMQCQDPIFYKRCCQSCNRNFTEEDFCRDSKILINGFKCDQFIAKYTQEICNYDPNVKNFCCASCKKSISFAPTPPTPTRTVPMNCQDNLFVRINSLPCEAFVAKTGLCDRPIVQQHCCGSCQSWNDLKK